MKRKFRKGYYMVMRENADAEFRRVQQEQADYIAQGRIPALEGRASKSGRTKIWAATPHQITIQYRRADNGYNYRDLNIPQAVQS